MVLNAELAGAAAPGFPSRIGNGKYLGHLLKGCSLDASQAFELSVSEPLEFVVFAWCCWWVFWFVHTSSLRGEGFGKKANKSLALLGAAPAWSRTTHNNKQRIRVRITDKEPTPYQQWEMQAFRRWNIPFARETVYLLPRPRLAQLHVPDGDVTIFNNDRVVVNGYDNNCVAYSTFYDASKGHDITQFTTLRQQLLMLAYRHGQKLEL